MTSLLAADLPKELVAAWEDWQSLIRVLLILLGLVLVRIVVVFAVRRSVSGVVKGFKTRAGAADTKALEASPLAAARLVQRARTVGSVLGSLTTWALVIIGLIMVLSELGVEVGALIAGAGFLGAAIGIGAQTLVRDIISGIFLVLEDQIGVGDVVDLGQANGVVETVGLRVTQVRDGEGTLWYVRNGEILRVGNRSQGWSKIVIDVPFPYETNVVRAIEVIREAAMGVLTQPGGKAALIGKPEVWGLEVLSAEKIVIRLIQQVRPSKQDEYARRLRLAIKSALDAEGLGLAGKVAPLVVKLEDGPKTGHTGQTGQKGQ